MDKYLAFASESEANNVLYTLEPTEWDNDGEDADALEPFVVQPKSPVRVWG
jgi:hypothetical protein